MQDFAPQEQFVAVLDCNDVTRKNLDTSMLRVAAPIIENNFPERYAYGIHRMSRNPSLPTHLRPMWMWSLRLALLRICLVTP